MPDRIVPGSPKPLTNAALLAALADYATDQDVQEELDALLAGENSWADTQSFGGGTTGGNVAVIQEWKTQGMHFPVTFTAGLTDFGEGQIDVNWSMTMNLGGESTLHPEWSENVEVFFETPSGQRLIEKNWAYKSVDRSVTYRPFNFNVDIDTHEADIMWRLGRWAVRKRVEAGEDIVFDINALTNTITCNASFGGAFSSSDARVLLSFRNLATTNDSPFGVLLETPIGNNADLFVMRGKTGSNPVLMRMAADNATGTVTAFDMSSNSLSNCDIEAYIRPSGTGNSRYFLGPNWSIRHTHSTDKFSVNRAGTDLLVLNSSGGLENAQFEGGTAAAPGIRFRSGRAGDGFRFVAGFMNCLVNQVTIFQAQEVSGVPTMMVGSEFPQTGSRLVVETQMDVSLGPDSFLKSVVSSGWTIIQSGGLATSFQNSNIAINRGNGDMVLNVPSGRSGRLRVANGGGYIVWNGTGLGFFEATPIGRQTLPVAATDSATTQSLANAIRTMLINFGLAN